MKRILLIICVFSLLLSCSDDEKAAFELDVIPSTVEFDYTQSIQKIYVGSNTSWSALSNQDWCTVFTSRKFGNDTVSIEVSENAGDERIAYISFNNPENTIIKTVKVIQKKSMSIHSHSFRQTHNYMCNTIKNLPLSISGDRSHF
jgi:hypothetical protein